MGSMSNAYYHRFRALVHVLDSKTLLDRAMSEVAVVLLHVLQEVVVDALLVGKPLLPGSVGD